MPPSLPRGLIPALRRSRGAGRTKRSPWVQEARGEAARPEGAGGARRGNGEMLPDGASRLRLAGGIGA